jgi:hypothetical protein
MVLNVPEILRSILSKERNTSNINLDALQYSVWGSPIPSISVPSKQTNFMGQVSKATSFHRPEFSDITIRFTVDNNFNNWWVLWKWLDLLNDHKESAYNRLGLPKPEVPKKRNYTTNMSMFGLNEHNKPAIEFTFIRTFIVKLGEIETSYRDGEEAESSCTFSFNQMDVKLLNIESDK